ncbi:MAG: ImmA/IrrE family metallo-endopeptidase [Planctomycetia bacterium]|nr:ImmA/IrrE family metallo-endopeptidase [Planctomycetia bacterium]
MNSIRQYSVKEIEANAWILLKDIYRTMIPTPIDVEYILEQNPYVIDFELINGFQTKYGIAGTVFRLDKDKFCVLIDESLADTSPYFYRFTVSEELSHIILHRNLINSVNSIEEALELQSDSKYKNMDRNAKRFAAALLMPYKLVVKDTEILFNQISIRNDNIVKEVVLREIIETLRKKYDVSRKTMIIRVNEWPLQLIDRIDFSIQQDSDELLPI